jgi:hypothetical protein
MTIMLCSMQKISVHNAETTLLKVLKQALAKNCKGFAYDQLKPLAFFSAVGRVYTTYFNILYILYKK